MLDVSKTVRAGPHGAVCNVFDFRARDPGICSLTAHLLSFPLPLIQKGQLLVTEESIYCEY